MKDIMYKELEKVCGQLRRIETESDREVVAAGTALVVETMNELIEMSLAARCEGLLALEDRLNNIGEDSPLAPITTVFTMVVDGIDPDVIEELATLRYFSSDKTPYQALQAIIILNAARLIMAGEHTSLLEEYMLASVTRLIAEAFKEFKKKKYQEAAAEEDPLDTVIDEICQGEIRAKFGEPEYALITMTDYIFSTFDNFGIQRLLREFDNYEIEFIMKGMSGEGRRAVFNNITRRLSQLIAEQFVALGPVGIKQVAKASFKCLTVLKYLIVAGEITGREIDRVLANLNLLDIPDFESLQALQNYMTVNSYNIELYPSTTEEKTVE